MTGMLASTLIDLAARMLPRRHFEWGHAMRAEVRHIEDPAAAVAHAAGCLAAALHERARDFDTRFQLGKSAIAMTTGMFACLHFACAVQGMGVLLGRPEGFAPVVATAAQADPELAAAYQAAIPLVTAAFMALGIAQLLAAYFLLRWQMHRFLMASGAALVIAVGAVALQLSVIWTLDGLPSEFFATLVQAVGLPMLLLWSNDRHTHPERAR